MPCPVSSGYNDLLNNNVVRVLNRFYYYFSEKRVIRFHNLDVFRLLQFGNHLITFIRLQNHSVVSFDIKN